MRTFDSRSYNRCLVQDLSELNDIEDMQYCQKIVSVEAHIQKFVGEQKYCFHYY